MRILRAIKKHLYFTVASYFRFFAAIYLKRWNPTVIAVIGSSGKTTLLHLFEAQLKDKAVYSHHANSAFGIPFHILGLSRKNFKKYEWFTLALRAPFQALRSVNKEKIYVVEADAERPKEGEFSSRLLKPHIVVWLSLEEAHGVNFDQIADKQAKQEERRNSVREVIAQEFGYFLEHARSLVVVNTDNKYIAKQAGRSKTKTSLVSEKDVHAFTVNKDSVEFITSLGIFKIPKLVPADVGLSVVAVARALEFLNIKTDPDFSGFVVPPSRSSVLAGKNNVTIIDSSYNATFGGMKAMLDLFKRYPASGEKWLVLGDMIEQGKSEEAQHQDLAGLVVDARPDRVVMVGPRLAQNTYPILVSELGDQNVLTYMMPREALKYLEREVKGGETIMFKGARYLEGVVEKMLEDPADAFKLCRREEIFVKKRKQWGI